MSWARRYLGSLGSQGKLVASHEVTARYQRDEMLTIAFETAYLAYRTALVTRADVAAVESARSAAASAASAMGLYSSGTPRVPLGIPFAGKDATHPAVAVPADGVVLRLL